MASCTPPREHLRNMYCIDTISMNCL